MKKNFASVKIIELAISIVLIITLYAKAYALPDEWSYEVKWQDKTAIINFSEPLHDPKTGPAERHFSIITRPYISWQSSTNVIISWEAIAEKQIPDEAPYFISEAKEYPFTTNIVLRSVELIGLEPDTAYSYKLASSGDGWKYESQTHPFRTLPPIGSKKLRFAIIGDNQHGWNHPHWPERGSTLKELLILNKLIKDWSPDVVLHVGDLTEIGGANHWGAKCNYINAINNLSYMSSIFTVACLGNHDSYKLHTYYFPYIAKERTNMNKGSAFYSIDIANLHFVCVTAIPDRKLLRDWLEADLTQNKQPWTIAFDHYPYHSIGFYNTKPANLRVCDLFDKFGIQLYVAGHDHNYQRTARISNNEERVLSDTGTVQIISGGAARPRGQAALPTPYWNLAHIGKFHYIQAEMDDTVITFKAIDLNGNAFDHWKLPIKGQPETIFNGKPYTIIDDRDYAVVYNNLWECVDVQKALWINPSWKQVQNINRWRSQASRSNVAGDYAKLTFTGNSIAWIGTKDKFNGIAEVYIDDKKIDNDIDTYAANEATQQLLFEKNDLPDGTHEIKIVVTGNKNDKSRDSFIEIDGFKIIDTK